MELPCRRHSRLGVVFHPHTPAPPQCRRLRLRPPRSAVHRHHHHHDGHNRGREGEHPRGGQLDPAAEGGVVRSPRCTFPLRVSSAAKDVVGRARAASADQGAKRALPWSLLESPATSPPGEARHGGDKTGVADQITPSKGKGNMSVEKRSAFKVI